MVITSHAFILSLSPNYGSPSVSLVILWRFGNDRVANLEAHKKNFFTLALEKSCDLLRTHRDRLKNHFRTYKILVLAGVIMQKTEGVCSDHYDEHGKKVRLNNKTLLAYAKKKKYRGPYRKNSNTPCQWVPVGMKLAGLIPRIFEGAKFFSVLTFDENQTNLRYVTVFTNRSQRWTRHSRHLTSSSKNVAST